MSVVAALVLAYVVLRFWRQMIALTAAATITLLVCGVLHVAEQLSVPPFQ